MKSLHHIRYIRLKKHRRARNKLGRRFWAVRAHKLNRALLPQIIKEFGL